jgi:hypothetical protein
MMRWLLWKPTNYFQAWLLALGIGLIVIVVCSASGQRAFVIGYVASVFVVAGLAGSVRIRRQRAITRRRLESPTS